jgi:hypothetical protein
MFSSGDTPTPRWPVNRQRLARPAYRVAVGPRACKRALPFKNSRTLASHSISAAKYSASDSLHRHAGMGGSADPIVGRLRSSELSGNVLRHGIDFGICQ